MNHVTSRQPTHSDAACRHLAVRVIQQAVRDLSAAGASRADQESARAFLCGSPMMHQWCEVAHLNSSWMVARASKLMNRSGRLAIRSGIQGDAAAKQPCIRKLKRQGNRFDVKSRTEERTL
ncbi:MAG: hypothetical protein DMF84_06565 [Acidobacteria bacterium]|nr:MAG: hypothetical protein DMF84_06565 [Acidobacteriota bacterium]